MALHKMPLASQARRADLAGYWLGAELLTLAMAAERAGCTPRRFRDLIGRGLIPKASRRGREAGYSQLHVARAAAVNALLKSKTYQPGDLADLLGPRSRRRFEQALELRGSSVVRALRRHKTAPLVDGLVLQATSTLSPFTARYVEMIVESIHRLALADRQCVERAEADIRELMTPAAVHQATANPRSGQPAGVSTKR